MSVPVESFRQRVRQRVLTFDGAPPAVPAIPGLVQSRREGNAIRLTLANPDAESDGVIARLGARSVEDVPLSLEDAVVAYLGERGERPSLLQVTQTAEVA